MTTHSTNFMFMTAFSIALDLTLATAVWVLDSQIIEGDRCKGECHLPQARSLRELQGTRAKSLTSLHPKSIVTLRSPSPQPKAPCPGRAAAVYWHCFQLGLGCDFQVTTCKQVLSPGFRLRWSKARAWDFEPCLVSMA